MMTYEAIYDPESENVYSVSLVESPAMESAFIALKKEDKPFQFAEVDKKERTLLGVALIPDKPIYRNQDGQEFYITFPKETIKASAHDFFKKGFQLNSKLEHESDIKGISFCESWIVKDSKNDTANAYGLPSEDIVEGAWILKMKCDNDEIYNKALSGEIKGFSIDGLFSLKEIGIKNETNMSKSITDAITKGFEDFRTLLMSDKEIKNAPTVDLTLGSVMSGEIAIMYEGETLEIGGAVWVESPEDETQRVALPVGEYPLEGGEVLVVAEDGIAAEVRTSEAPPEEAPAEMNDDTQARDVQSVLKSELIKYKKLIDEDAKASNDILLAEIKKLSNKVMTLSEQPAGKRIVATPTQLTKQGRILEKLRNNRK
jgi:hypothetical protein